MPLGDDAHEFRFGVGDVGKRLPRFGIRIKDHEVDRVTGLQRHADFRVFLEAADARAMTGARIDDDVGTQLVVDLHARRRDDAHECVVDGPLERAPVGQHLVAIREHRRLAGLLVGDPVVAALAQRVPEEDRTLREVDRVLGPILEGLLRHVARCGRGLQVFGLRLPHMRDVRLGCLPYAPRVHRCDAARDLQRAVDRLIQIGHSADSVRADCCNATC